MAQINLIMDHISQYVPFDEGFLRVSVKIVIQFLKAYFSAGIIHLEGPVCLRINEKEVIYINNTNVLYHG